MLRIICIYINMLLHVTNKQLLASHMIEDLTNIRGLINLWFLFPYLICPNIRINNVSEVVEPNASLEIL